MGKTKIKTFDESAQEVEDKKKKTSSKKKVEEVRGDGERGAPLSARSEQSESRTSNGAASRQDPEPQETEPANEEPESESVDQSKETSKSSKSKKPGKAKPRSKKYQEITKDLDRTQAFPLSEAVDKVKSLSYSKFNGTLEAHITTAQTGIRGLVSLPYVSGKKLRILAFGKGSDQSGADILGSDEIIEEINKGKVDFDLVITTPEWIPKLTKVARILGPKGLMPNPKNGTITDDLKKAVEGFQAGKTEYKTESKAPVIHLSLGKLDQPTEELSANIKTLLQTLGKSRVKKVSLTPTIGPAVKLDLSSI